MREVAVYRSVHHPAGTPGVLLYAQWLVRPLAVCSLPVMILTLVEVLQGHYILPYLYAAFPAAFLVASAWTAYRIRTAPAEVAVAGPYAEVRTVRDVLSGRVPSPWRLVLEVRKSEDHLLLAVGESVYELSDDEWPDRLRLLRALQAARMAPGEDPAVGSVEPPPTGAAQ